MTYQDIISRLATGRKSQKGSRKALETLSQQTKTVSGAAIHAALAHRSKDRVVAHVRMQCIDGPNGSVIVDQDQYERWMQGLEEQFTIYDGSDNPYVDALLAAWKQPSETNDKH